MVVEVAREVTGLAFDWNCVQAIGWVVGRIHCDLLGSRKFPPSKGRILDAQIQKAPAMYHTGDALWVGEQWKMAGSVGRIDAYSGTYFNCQREVSARGRSVVKGTHQICTLLADISNFFASSILSSVVGKAVRLYTSFNIFN